MNKTLFATIFLISVFSFHAPVIRAQQASGSIYSKMAADVLAYINEYRTGKGLSPLKNNDVIAQVATKHSGNMASGKIPFGHDGFDARTADLGKKLHRMAGFAENVAYGATTARQVVDMWLHSPVHKKNIGGDYELSGIGIARAADGSLYFTQIFVSHS